MYWGACDRSVPGRVYVIGYNSTTPRHPSFSRSDDYGLTWSPMVIIDSTVENQYGYAVAGAGDVVYAGADYSGLYRSTDGGLTWETKNAGITPTTLYIRALAIDTSDPNIVIAGTSGGIFRTTNAGDTWVKTGTVMTYYMSFSDADPNIGYAGYNYVYRTTDRGLTWTRPLPGLMMRYLKGFAPDPVNGPGVVCWGSSGVFKSSDSGLNWSCAQAGLRVSMVGAFNASPTDPARLYLDVDDCGMFYSTDGGTTWDTCRYFLSCGGICDIGVVPGANRDTLYALEGSG